MVDLDSNPTKLIEVVDVGKQMLVTRGALTTFSIANDVSSTSRSSGSICDDLPALDALNHHAADDATERNSLRPSSSTRWSSLLVPLALRGVKTRAASAGACAAPQPADLRARRHHSTVHWHQGCRSAVDGNRCRVIAMDRVVTDGEFHE
jgi:hypothetical protein